MKSVIAIRHVAFEDLGSLANVFEQRGYQIRYIEAESDDLGSIDPGSPDIVVILGGPIGAYDEESYSFLLDELKMLKYRLEADLPTLGICLGAQLMARVLGAKVYPGAQGKEIGWLPITLSKDGQRSALRHLSAADAVLHWHGDTFTLPEGCVHLASSAKYKNQAFAYKRNILALQFHPEVMPRALEKWFIGHACEIDSTPEINVWSLRQETQQYSEKLQLLAASCWQSWLDQIEGVTHLSDTQRNGKTLTLSNQV